MCGIAGIVNIKNKSIANIDQKLSVMNNILAHRGPDGRGYFKNEKSSVGFSHNRLSIIDIETGQQPMVSENGNAIVYNGEIYNFIELRVELGEKNFKTTSDTEVILKAYEKWGDSCVTKLRGMFAFAIFDKKRNRLFAARDRFGIKPFYYAAVNEFFIFASEPKAILPFLPVVETDMVSLKEYFTFQFTLEGKTLFKNIKQLLPAHTLSLENGTIKVRRYWEIHYNLDWHHTENYYRDKLSELLSDSIKMHLRSDVPVGTYLSGGLDSSIVATLGKQLSPHKELKAFTGLFKNHRKYSELVFAKSIAQKNNLRLFEKNITVNDFIANIRKVIYHLDYPIAGPGAFPQFMVSKLAAKHVKVVLGGQGGDEIFGGYVRYLIAYFEQCIKGAIEGTMDSGSFVVTYESIIPNLSVLRDYKPLMKDFLSSGFMDDRDMRYLKLINRSDSFNGEIASEKFDSYSILSSYKKLYWSKNVSRESYFDSMTHFDFKTLLPALLHVEDRMSMANGLESRVPYLDHPLVEFLATIPSNIKFKNGKLKNLLRSTYERVLPKEIIERKDKMGFPVPLTEWMRENKKFKEFIFEILGSRKARNRGYLKSNLNIDKIISEEREFGRKVWALLSLELWQQEFHDKIHKYKKFNP